MLVLTHLGGYLRSFLKSYSRNHLNKYSKYEKEVFLKEFAGSSAESSVELFFFFYEELYKIFDRSISCYPS